MSRQVLVRATISADGLTAAIAPGVEVPVSAVRVVADEVPEVSDDLLMVLVMGFASGSDRDRFAEEFHAWISPGVAAVA